MSAPVGQEANISAIADDQIYHVYPTFGREHITNQRDRCWCHPKIEFAHEGAIILHEVEQ